MTEYAIIDGGDLGALSRDLHYGTVTPSENRIYLIHSEQCHVHYDELRECPYSVALTNGIDEESWVFDVTVPLEIRDGKVYPA
jgi:hypothetical protein